MLRLDILLSITIIQLVQVRIDLSFHFVFNIVHPVGSNWLYDVLDFIFNIQSPVGCQVIVDSVGNIFLVRVVDVVVSVRYNWVRWFQRSLVENLRVGP